ncbi:MAG: hypothetical protein J6C31_05360 [Prevotella sp.]|nr:hypothetical protein [Prevotella sp.]
MTGLYKYKLFADTLFLSKAVKFLTFGLIPYAGKYAGTYYDADGQY